MSESGTFNIYFYTTVIFAIASTITLIMYQLSITNCPAPTLCAEPKYKYKYTTVPTVDSQFSQSNFPSVVYDEIFTGQNTYQGGYQLDQGKGSTAAQNGISTRPVTISGYVPS